MSTVFNLILFTGATVYVSAQATPKWEACAPARPCVIEEKSATFLATLVTEDKTETKNVSAVEIVNKATGAKQVFKVNEVNTINLNEDFELDRVHELRPGGVQDLALLAYLSAREGKSYYYFLYDQRTRQFVMNHEILPKLQYDAKKNVYVTELQQQTFRLNSSLQFKAPP